MIENKPYTTNNLVLGECINVLIGISGLLSGQIMIGFTESFAMYLSSKIHENAMIVTLDEQVKSSVFELCKLIVGNSCISLYNSGVSANITSSGIINGESIEYSSVGQEIICIPFETQQGKMVICLQLQKFNDNYVED